MRVRPFAPPWRFVALASALVGATAGAARTARAQAILVAPTAVVATDRVRTGALTLINTGEHDVEVRLSTAYGYPVTDSAGAMTLRLFDAVQDTMPSAASWVRFFPDRLLLATGQRRTVRLLVTPPAGLRDGEYWSRVVVSARRASEPAGAEGTPAIAIGLALEVRSILALFYRQGAVATRVRLDAVRAAPAGDSLVVRARLTREGAAAFVGSLRAVLRDARGVARAEASLPLGVYYALEPRIALPTRGLAAGAYALTLEALSARADLPSAALLPAPPERREATVVLP